MKALNVLVFLLLPVMVSAHHAEDHNAFIVGERAKAKAIMCDSDLQVISLLVAKKYRGMKGLLVLYNKYSSTKNFMGEPTCWAEKEYKFIVKKQVYSDVVDGVPFFVLQVKVRQRNKNWMTYYILSTWPVERNRPVNTCFGNCIPA